METETNTQFEVCVVQTSETYLCSEQQSLLKGMLKLGKKGIPVGCENGGCGVCKVLILEGDVLGLGPISKAHVSAEDASKGYTLACRVAPKSKVTLEVVGRLQKPFKLGSLKNHC